MGSSAWSICPGSGLRGPRDKITICKTRSSLNACPEVLGSGQPSGNWFSGRGHSYLKAIPFLSPFALEAETWQGLWEGKGEGNAENLGLWELPPPTSPVLWSAACQMFVVVVLKIRKTCVVTLSWGCLEKPGVTGRGPRAVFKWPLCLMSVNIVHGAELQLKKVQVSWWRIFPCEVALETRPPDVLVFVFVFLPQKLPDMVDLTLLLSLRS